MSDAGRTLKSRALPILVDPTSDVGRSKVGPYLVAMWTGNEVVDNLIFDLEEDSEEDKFIIVCALASEYLQEEENRKRPSFYVQDRLEWQKHVKELLTEDAFL